MFRGGDMILVGNKLMRFDKNHRSNTVIACFEN